MQLAVTGDLVAADAMIAHGVRPEIADVICSACPQPPGWLARTLDHYPGCAVAAVQAGNGRCFIAARVGSLFTFSYSVQNDPELPACASGLRSGALVCAVFVHAWLAAGWPPDAMARTRCLVMLRAAVPISFALYYDGPVPGPVCGHPSSPNRLRISSASGAPMAE
jgi:hypothetical protein